MLNYQLKHLIKSKNNENTVSRKVWYRAKSKREFQQQTEVKQGFL